MTEQLAAGQVPDVDALAAQYPHLAGELRRLWGAVMVADAIATAVRLDPNLTPLTAATLPATPRQTGERPAALPRTFGEYTLEAQLGQGGMGVVYRARHQRLGRVVALKMISRGELASDTDLARFRTEAQAAARLQHPNIVPVYEVHEHDHQPYYTMLLVEGTTLARRLAEGPLPPHEAAQILLCVARAVHYAHENDVLHRDLKPANILLDRDGRPLVTDFGLAKCMESGASLTRTGTVLGTPAYMAPEQALGRHGDSGRAADVYSLGAILYAMLTGHPPFQAASDYDILMMVREQDPLPPRLLNPRADRDLEMIALKCLQKPPGLRYASAAALADDLQNYLQGDSVSARSGAFTQIIARWFRETHHATILENWGLLWMLHSAALLVLCLITNSLKLQQVQSIWAYLGLWTLGLGAWAGVFWMLRRRAGPVTFVERQIAHLWAGSMIAIGFLFWVERLLDLPPLKLSPVLAIVSGSIFLAKGGILSGRFYFQAVALFITAPVMAVFPTYDILIFGVVSALSFFVPGLKYYRQRALGLKKPPR
jgi:serine/threonine-protein kinase